MSNALKKHFFSNPLDPEQKLIQELAMAPIITAEKRKVLKQQASFSIKLDTTTEYLNLEKSIAENGEKLYRSVKIENRSNSSYREFFSTLESAPSLDLLFLKSERGQGEYYFIDEEYNECSYLSGYIHRLCQKYKKNRDIFPCKVKTISVGTVYDYMSGDSPHSCPSCEITLTFENGEVDILITLEDWDIPGM